MVDEEEMAAAAAASAAGEEYMNQGGASRAQGSGLLSVSGM